MRVNKKVLSALSVSVCAVLVLCGCEKPSEKALYTWDLVDLGEGVTLHTQLQEEYLSGDYLKITSYAKGSEELSRPQAVKFEWSASPVEDGTAAVRNYTLEYSLSEDFSNSLSFDTTKTEYDVYNLCVASTYYWRVTAVLADGKKSVSPTATFSTEDSAPRNLYVDGITNVRDIGGWKTADGGRVKQGMMIRCGRLNESETPNVNIEITLDGIITLLYELGIRSEIDLRMQEAHNHESGGITSSPLGEDVNYYNVQLEWENGNYLLNNRDSVLEFFRLAADESNYPFIFHCNIGTDRTGMFAFLVNGLLGVSEEDLYRDYLFSNFGKINNTRTLDNIKNNYLATIKSYEGDTLSEQIENCLLGIGVPQAHLDAVKAIMMD